MLRFKGAHLDSTTRGARARSLSLRGTSGERAGERGTTLLVTTPIASKTALLSPALSSLEGRRGRIPAPGVVVLSRCAPPHLASTRKASPGWSGSIAAARKQR